MSRGQFCFALNPEICNEAKQIRKAGSWLQKGSYSGGGIAGIKLP
jgi:hypothetical protein